MIPPSVLRRARIADADVPAVMTIAQICELVGMAVLLPLLLPKIGIRWALAIGVIAWPIRYIVFAIGTPELKALVLGSLGLHGIGYTFFFVVSFIYVDKVAPSNIRNSAQSLVTMVTGARPLSHAGAGAAAPAVAPGSAAADVKLDDEAAGLVFELG